MNRIFFAFDNVFWAMPGNLLEIYKMIKKTIYINAFHK